MGPQYNNLTVGADQYRPGNFCFIHTHSKVLDQKCNILLRDSQNVLEKFEKYLKQLAFASEKKNIVHVLFFVLRICGLYYNFVFRMDTFDYLQMKPKILNKFISDVFCSKVLSIQIN